VEPTEGRPCGDGIVIGTVRRGRFDLALLDLSRLAIPVAALPPVTAADWDETHETIEAGTDRHGVPRDLICAVEGGFIALPLARVLSVERAGVTLALSDTAGRPGAGGPAAMAVTVALTRGRAVLGVAQVLGPRQPGTPGYHDATLLDCDGLEPADGLPVTGGQDQPGLSTRVMYLLGAGDRLALLPASKALFVGAIDHWCPLPGGDHGPDGMVPLGGAILPALDLGRLFGDAVCARPMAMALDARGTSWAVACDSISERHGRIEGRPMTLDGLATLGQARIAEGLVPVLDADRLVLPGQAS
jgi:hypothetical protein